MISIIIPTFNRAKTIGKVLETILAQTYKNYELIIVNDGSKDNTDNVIEGYVSKIKEANIGLQYFNQANQGAPAARNNGLKHARGEYLLFCDADAELRPEMLEQLLKALTENPEISYAFSSFFWGKKLFKPEPFTEAKLKSGPFIHTSSLIRRADFPQSGWDESIKKLQDWDLWLTMLEAGKKGFFVDQVLYKINPGGTISSWLPSFAYKLFPFLPSVKKYKRAVEIIKQKHNLL